jgi:ATP-binding cassette subfamily F protein 3
VALWPGTLRNITPKNHARIIDGTNNVAKLPLLYDSISTEIVIITMEAEIQSQVPGIDAAIARYTSGFIQHVVGLPDQDDDALADTLTALLVSASGNFTSENETSLRNLVEKLISKVTAANGIDPERRQMAPSAKRLDQSIHVGSQRNISSTLALAGGNVDLEATAGRKVESRVDRKKLEKAERKIRAKQERKVMKNVEYETSRLLNVPDETQSYEEFYMSVNPLQLGSDSSNKSKDIKVDGIDVSISGKRILTDTNLTLAYGRRYGLVGQNGIGMHGRPWLLHISLANSCLSQFR